MYIDPLLLTLIVVCDAFVVAHFITSYRYLRLQGRETWWLIYPILGITLGLFMVEVSLILREAAWQTIINVLGSHVKP